MAARVYEGVVYLVLHCVSTFVAIAAVRAVLSRRRPAPPLTPGGHWRLQFRLLDLLLANAAIAAFASQVACATSQPIADGWTHVITTATSATVLACSFAWFCTARSRLVLPLFAVFLAAFVHALVWRSCNWFKVLWITVVSGWYETIPYSPWSLVLSQVGVVTLITLLLRPLRRDQNGIQQSGDSHPLLWKRRIFHGITVFLVVCITAPVVLLGWGLSRPLPPIEAWPEEENCFPDLTQLAVAIATNTVPDALTTSGEELHAYAQQQAPLVARLRSFLNRPCSVPVDYTPGSSDARWNTARKIEQMLPVARLLQACGRGEAFAGRVAEAAQLYLNIVQLSSHVSRAGLIDDRCVGNWIEGFGLDELSAIRTRLPVTQRRALLWALLEVESGREPHVMVWNRENAWAWRVYGWSFRLGVLVDSPIRTWFASTRTYQSDANSNVDALRRARFALLTTDLALREFHNDRNIYPSTLNELVPKYLPSGPMDPFSGQPLKYRQSRETYVLYSVGPNTTDDGGQEVLLLFDVVGRGDLFLDFPRSLELPRDASPTYSGPAMPDAQSSAPHDHGKSAQ